MVLILEPVDTLVLKISIIILTVFHKLINY